ncbi:MAG: hypothetical protein KC466_07025, partial [Myxococcales bacterium]|nr:hypothetical protein [Myxococcales bacterium]
DAAVEGAVRDAHALGLKVFVKPHLWSRDFHRGEWPGTIAMESEADWARWFESYRTFALHFAALAERTGADLFSVGVELAGTSGRDDDWRRLIAAVRTVYRGPLTYAANGVGELDAIEWWDAVDLIGVDAYFPLSAEPAPDLATLKAGWAPTVARLEKLSRRFDRRILFTEAGYKSAEGAATEPWAWSAEGRPRSERLQADCYRALFESLWDRPWFAGVYWWKYFTAPDPARYREDTDFTPRGKEAESVLRAWYGGSAEP